MGFREEYRKVLDKHTNIIFDGVVLKGGESAQLLSVAVDYYRERLRSCLDAFALDVVRAMKEKK